MKDIKNEDILDLFNQELTNKQRKEEKKIAKLRAKEKRKQLKKEKKLEKLEDIEFAKKIEENNNEEENILDLLKPSESLTRTKINENIGPKKHYFLNFLLGLFIIVLLITSCDYFVYTILKEKELKLIITSSLLIALVIFYILSIIIKKESIKKIFQILATISIASYMAYQLFII